jgi:ATP-binding cassette, subfamily B, bacterial IrtB/YbtQ
MIEKLMKKYALSRKGAYDFIKSTAACVVNDIAMMLPVALLYFFVMQLLPVSVGGTAGTNQYRGPLYWLCAVAAVFLVLYVVNWIKYDSQFLSTYKESAVRRMTLAEKLRELPLSFFGRKDISDLTTTIMGDCTRLEQAFSHWFPTFAASIISTLIIAVSLFFFNVKLAAASLWVIPVALLIVFFSRCVQNWAGRKKMAADIACADGIQECLETVRDLKSNNAERRYLSGLDEKIRKIEKVAIKSEYVTGVFVVSAQMVLKFGIVTTAFIGSMMLARGEIPLLTFIMFLIVVSRIYDPLGLSLQNLAAIINTQLNIDRMNELYDCPVQTGTTRFEPADSTIVFDHAGFSYNEGEAVLRDVSFTAKQGEVTALIGPSGGGKSTAAKLAARFWDVDRGAVTFGGIPVRSVDPETLLSRYSIVFQDVTLFNNTVMENIRIGKYGASDEEVRAAAHEAQCDEFVQQLPHGYETVIGENGSELSGGERQRLSIARALLKNAPIILLDEATASLDAENETKVQRALSRLVKGRTVLVIAHRMRTVSGADHIVLLKDGVVAEDGTPEELLSLGGLYAHMVSLQKTDADY